MSPDLLWKPDIALYNKQDLSNGILAADPKSSSTNVQLFSNGNIFWTVPVSHKVPSVLFKKDRMRRCHMTDGYAKKPIKKAD